MSEEMKKDIDYDKHIRQLFGDFEQTPRNNKFVMCRVLY